MAAPTVIRRVLARPLSRPGRPIGAMPAMVAAAVMPRAGEGWPEYQQRYALELVGDCVSGWYGSISQTVVNLMRDHHGPGLLGHDAAQHRRLPYRPISGRHRSGAHARMAHSAVELACWDLTGKATGQPVTELLGSAVRESVPVYASAIGLDPEHPAAEEIAGWLNTEGYWGQKWPLSKRLLAKGPRAVARCLAGLRAAAPNARLMVDGLGGGRVDQALALLPVFQEVEVTWAEELLPSGSPGWARLADARGCVPLAAGEHAYDEAEQVRLQNSGQIDVWQVDVGWCGGLSRALHTVEVAAEQGMPTFPHGDSLTSALTLAAVCCNDKIPAVEYHLTLEPIRQSTARTPTLAASGRLAVAQEPGLNNGFHLDSSKPAIVLAEGGDA